MRLRALDENIGKDKRTEAMRPKFNFDNDFMPAAVLGDVVAASK